MHRWLAFTLALAGCFPHQPTLRKATLATEGAMIVAGVIVMTLTPKSTESCTGSSDFPYVGSCSESHSNLELVGPALLIPGLVGALITSASAPSDR